MRKTLCAFVALVTAGFAADTPSLAGKVYRETGAIASIRRTWEKTIVFTTENRFTYLQYAEGNPLNSGIGSRVLLQTPHSDGTYVVRHVAGSADVADLTFDDGSRAESVVADLAGGESPANASFPDLRYTWTDLTTIQAASNVSLRGRVTEGRPLIAGFVVPGTPRGTDGQIVPPRGLREREVLIRVVGPSLVQFGVAGVWADPTFKLYLGAAPAQVNEVPYTDWGSVPNGTINGTPIPPTPNAGTAAAFQKIFSFAGAFPLTANSKDSAMLTRLSPGNYTVVCEAGAGDAGGEALIEIYFLP